MTHALDDPARCRAVQQDPISHKLTAKSGGISFAPDREDGNFLSHQGEIAEMQPGSVLCPIDFDEASFAALPLAAEQAKARDAYLDLLHIWQPGREYVQEGPPIPFAEEMPRERIEQDLAALPVDLPAERVRYHVTGGKPGQDIVDMASSLDSELVVMGTHARRGIRRWFVGSVCEWVLHHCHCPILVCRGPERVTR